MPWSLGMENSSLGATQSLFRSHQQHFLNAKKFGEERNNSNQKKLFPLGCVSWASLIPPPSPQCISGHSAACLGVSTPSPQDGAGGDRTDGRLCPCTGSGMGLGCGEGVPGCGAGGLQQGGERSRIALCGHTALLTHTLRVGCRRGRVSPGPPVLAWAASRRQGGQDEALLLLPVRGSGTEGALRCRCDAATAPPGLNTGGTAGQGQQQQHQGCPPPTPLRQPDPSPRPASSEPCPCGMEVPLAVADSGHGAELGATPGAPRGAPAPGHCSAVSSPLLLSQAAPAGVLAPHGAGPPR